MAFLVEDGTGIKGATSYATVAFFVSYFGDRGVDISGITNPDGIEDLLVKGASHIDRRWGPQFKGTRRYATLASRSILTLTANPTDGETVTVGGVTYTFRAAPSLDSEVEIGIDALRSLVNLANSNQTNDDVYAFSFADPDVAALTIKTINDGVATTETLANGSFDNPTTTGESAKRQPLEWPRDHAYDSRGDALLGVPTQLMEANCEYALRFNSGDLDPDPSVNGSGLKVKKTKVGPIEQEFEAGQNVSIKRDYPAADRLLTELIFPLGTIIRV